LGYIQRGGSPSAKDRYYASVMGAYAVDLLLQGKANRIVCYRQGSFTDLDIDEALAEPKKGLDAYHLEVAKLLSAEPMMGD
jgi:6-phosphofructokinase 1